MTSKNLFFKLMKENTKQRLWTVALISVIFFFSFPVQAALNASNSLDPNRLNNAKDPALALLQAQEELGRFFMNWCGIQNGYLIFLMFLFAAICGVSGFSYLHSKKKTDFYHSLPVRREQLFAVQYLNGVLYVAIPYLLSMLIAAGITSSRGALGLSWIGMIKGYLMHLAFYLLLYSTVILAVMMTGNVIVSLLGSAVFFGWAPCVMALAEGYYQTYYETYYHNTDVFLTWCCRLSPAAWYIRAASAEEPALMAVKGLLAAAVITVLAVVLYRKRPSEAAGRAMAFGISKPVIKTFIVVPSALLGSLMLRSMMRKDTWSVFGLVCGLLLSYCVIEIIYNFDFRKLFAHKRQLALCAILSASALAFFRFDLSGYDSYLPSEERLASAGVYCYVLDGDAVNNYQVTPKAVRREDGSYRYMTWEFKTPGELAGQMRLDDSTPVLEIARQGIEDARENRKYRFSGGRYAENTSGGQNQKYSREVTVAYHLQNGKTVFRSYTVDLYAVREQMDAIYNQRSYKEGMYPVLAFQAEDIAGINYKEQSECSHVFLENEAQKKKLLETYQKELSGLTADIRRTENPVAALQFKTNEVQAIIDEIREAKGDYAVFNEYLYYPVYSSFSETMEVLSELGIEVGSKLTADTVEKIVLQYYGTIPVNAVQNDGKTFSRPEISEGTTAEYIWQDQEHRDYSMDNPSVTVTDKAQIQQILGASVSNELGAANLFNEKYGGLNITAYVPYNPAWKVKKNEAEETVAISAAATAEYGYVVDSDASFRTYSLEFDYDKIPEFVKKEFGLTEELMSCDVSKAY